MALIEKPTKIIIQPEINTGENRILRADIIQDCGNSLNENIDIGQIEGGFIQGIRVAYL